MPNLPTATAKKSPNERRAVLEAQRARLDLRIRALTAQERERSRREDARAKIILGGALLAFFRREPVAARALVPRLLPLVAERDRDLVARFFENSG
ncbi:MAG: hypothetical protein CVT72_01655 [Alphaproteobacteria bacterium HGW-Alphaproteobacteria-11]|nr:MAG: hypothetical protein CVT72_01655 [Alphaproteobacteria bacterium HGW-Alphaproteobacteria-11]